MELLYNILYSVRASGTHHKIALRALAGLRDDPLSQLGGARAWRRVFLRYGPTLLEGAKAPDTRFKDFANHVLHPGVDGGADWGGAPATAGAWYAKTVERLRAQDWSGAAEAFGVLTHYYSDPLMPLHTGSSDAEGDIHRAVEWSVSRAQAALWATAPEVEVEAPDGPHWVAEMVRAGARLSHAHYWDIIEHYDFDKGVVDPPAGLDAESRALLAPLLAHAAAGSSRLLERAIVEAGSKPPKVDLAAATFSALAETPIRWVLNKLADADDRAVVEAMYEELAERGVVVDALPEENRAVRAALARNAKGRAAPSLPKAASAPSAPRPARPSVSSVAALELSADVERAPSIGPKTAARLARLDVRTVGDLLNADPERIAKGLDLRGVDAERIVAWKDQARLLTVIPRLRQGHAVMLVAAGYRLADDLAGHAPEAVHVELLAVADTAEIRSALRSPRAPDLETVRDWVEAVGRRAAA